jgi:hypothetical protein
MRLTPPKLLPTAWALGAIALGALPLSSSLHAADHADAPLTTKDASADITDVYAWHDDTNLTVAFGFAGLAEAGAPAQYDAGVLYTVHIDNNGDNEPDHDVLVRFGQNSAGDWGIRVEDLPGVADPVIGPVETTIEAGLGLRVFAGLRDDAFFFDLDGFRATLMTGELMFDATNDTFAGTNITAVVLEMSIDAVAGGASEVSVWVSTGRRDA